MEPFCVEIRTRTDPGDTVIGRIIWDGQRMYPEVSDYLTAIMIEECGGDPPKLAALPRKYSGSRFGLSRPIPGEPSTASRDTNGAPGSNRPG